LVKDSHATSRLVVVSVDGMLPEFYRRAGDRAVKIANTLSLVAGGSSADGVESVYPSTTYPAHATLVTGVPPRTHGIYSHLASLDSTATARPWHWFARAIRVPALWSAARATGRKTAAVSWPVSAGAAIDWNIPEIWDPTAPDPHQDLQTVVRHSTPGLFEEVVSSLLPGVHGAAPDRLRAEAALYLWRHYQPDLLLVHFVEYDQQAHRHGPYSPDALAALERGDAEIGRLREAAAGDERVTFVVLSDHGFVPVENEAAPLVALGEEQLFGAGGNGKRELQRLGTVHAGGSFAIYWLETPTTEERNSLSRALERLGETGAVAEVVGREKLEALGADPDAECILDAAPGFYFSDRFEGPMVRPSVKDRGTHGQLPTRAGMEASFVAAGPGIASGRNLGRIAVTQVARALMRQLGLPCDTLAAEADFLALS
jgi:predicted AlkP superfamily pyrophosphatase or phosphodiesterase